MAILRRICLDLRALGYRLHIAISIRNSQSGAIACPKNRAAEEDAVLVVANFSTQSFSSTAPTASEARSDSSLGRKTGEYDSA
jgi:hypothetical protein